MSVQQTEAHLAIRNRSSVAPNNKEKTIHLWSEADLIFDISRDASLNESENPIFELNKTIVRTKHNAKSTS